MDLQISRRRWGVAACGCLLAGRTALAADLPPGYTAPAPVTDLSRAPGLRHRQLGGEAGARRFALIFAKGDEIMSGLTAFARTESVGAAHLTAIGAIETGLFGWFDRERRAYRDIPVGQSEVASLVGDIALVEGKPAAHVHAVVALPDGTTRGGHLLHATVWPTLELFLTETGPGLDKRRDAETGLDLFDLG